MNSFNSDHLPPLRQVIHDLNLLAKKSLGQNFLLDMNITRKIARLANLPPLADVIEIGPGPGGLTRALLENPIHTLTAVELDDRIIPYLQQLQNIDTRLHIIHQNAVGLDVVAKTPYATPQSRAIVANLPYQVASPLLLGWLKQTAHFHSFTLMFQEEVAERLVASPSSKAYGRLSVMTQWLCEADIVLRLPPSAFTPPPSINSAVIRLKPRILPSPSPSFATMEKLVAAAFSQRRKMLRGSLKLLLKTPEIWLEKAEILPTARAEELNVQQYCRLAILLEKMYL
ncbi:MAG: 16S rRNA (adenine(1518)-N(6)/adenine(1519)-N(6))-dimethyltransferase RsmA [Alphaproteobacteria bacterium]